MFVIFANFRDLIPSGAFDEGTKVVLANAAYFKGNWKSQFDSEETKKDNFYVRRDKVTNYTDIQQLTMYSAIVSLVLKIYIGIYC